MLILISRMVLMLQITQAEQFIKIIQNQIIYKLNLILYYQIILAVGLFLQC